MEKKGKCFSKVNRGQRKKGDCYYTPYRITQSLLDVEPIDRGSSILEPACGDGAIVSVLADNGYNPCHYDIKSGADFLKEKRAFATVITNPPYSLALEFVKKAQEIATCKICFFLKLDFLSGQKRFEELYDKMTCFPLVRIYCYSRMPFLTDSVRSDGKYRTAMQTYAWFVWERKLNYCANKPIFHWLDSKMHVVKKGE